jgi:predicted ATP-grasp superfamily ATP-dependent carboligase
MGANADAVPHTRVPLVVGSSTNDELVRRLGLSRPQYQGITGVVGVLQQRLEKLNMPAISLRVGVPHYLGNAQHPKSSAALLHHLEHVLGVPTDHVELAAEIERWQSLHDEAVAEDAQAVSYVRMLERQFDQRAEALLPTSEDLAAELEAFLNDLEFPDEP